MNGRQRVLAMLDGAPVDRLPLLPITMMFAADRIGAPYRDYATDHRVLVQGQLATAEQFEFDYVSAISDPAREAADCGAAVEYPPDQPPAIDEARALLSDKRILAALKPPDPLGGGRMHDRVQAIAALREHVGTDLVVEGWVEGPCAEAADLRGINNLMLDFLDDPGFVQDLFVFIVELETRFAAAQLAAGADLIGIGDAAASLIGPQLYEEMVWPYERQLVEAIQARGGRVRLHICGNTSALLAGIGRLGCDLVDLDFPVSMAAARAAMGPEQVLLGNIDPVRVLRNGTPAEIARAIAACHEAVRPHYIAGAGCEVVRDTPAENLRALVDYAKSHAP